MKIIKSFILLLIFVLILASCSEEIEPPITIEYQVQFNVNGGTSIAPITVKEGEQIEKPTDPIKELHTFDGWYIDSSFSTAFDFTQPIRFNITLYARWIQETEPISNKIDEDIAALVFITEPIREQKIEFPTRGPINNSTITWTIDNQDIINRHGIVFHPAIGSDDIVVTLTAKFSLAGMDKFETYEVIVPAIDEIEISRSQEIPFTNMTGEFDVADSFLMTFFTENGGLPYVDILQFLEMLDGLIYFEELEFYFDGDLLTIHYQIEYEEKDDLGNVIETEVYDYQIIIDFKANTLRLDSLSFFDGYIQSTETDYSAGLTYLDTYYEDGHAITFELNPYRLDITIHEHEGESYYLFPFHLANILFTSSSYYNVYYNGDGYYGVYSVPSLREPGSEAAIAYETIRSSSLNSTEMPLDVLFATYDMLAFTLDNFYGLKAQRGVTSYYEFMRPTRDAYMTGKVRDLSTGLFNFFTKTLDDLHTSHNFPSYYEPSSFTIPLNSLSQLGPRVRSWYDVLFAVQDELARAFPDQTNNIPPDYRFIDNNQTAIIYLDGFYTATVENPDGDDSDRLMREVLAEIRSINPEVKNIVIDLSYNTGGNLGALLRVLGHMTEEPIRMSYMNPRDGSNVTYFVEVETNALTNVNWFILTSKVTFSAANLMASIAKDMGIATILGTQSGGGASSITPIILPNGTFFTMSSLNVLSYRTGNDEDGYTYYSIEDGIEPDVVLAVKDLYNPQKIAEAIESTLQP